MGLKELKLMYKILDESTAFGEECMEKKLTRKDILTGKYPSLESKLNYLENEAFKDVLDRKKWGHGNKNAILHSTIASILYLATNPISFYKTQKYIRENIRKK